MSQMNCWHSSYDPRIFKDHLFSFECDMVYFLFTINIFMEFLLNLLNKFQGKVRYIVRPVLPSGCEANIGSCGAVGATDSLNLGGYGVELAFKNMEYKAMDDSTIKEG